MVLRLCTSIEQEDVTLFQVVDKPVIVQHLSLHGGDGGECQGIAVTAGYLLDSRSHLALMDARPHRAVGCEVHLRAQVDTLLNQAYLFLILIVALFHDGLDEFHRGFCGLGSRLHTQQFP